MRWQCESGEGRLPIVGATVFGLGVFFPIFFGFFQLNIWESLIGAAGFALLIWVNAGPRRKMRFRLYEDHLVVEHLSPGIGKPSKIYFFDQMQGEPIALKHNPIFGMSTIKVGRTRDAIKFELYDRKKAEELLRRLKSEIASSMKESS